MINKWILDNFKSIESREELEFRPLTVFTGANSSGKSTILQSILLVSQTLQSPIVSRSIVLNGGIKKFGSYSDIVNQRQFKKDLTVGFEISDDQFSYKRFATPWIEPVKTLSCQFIVGARKDEDLQPYMKELHLKSENASKKEASIHITRNSGPSEFVKKIVGKGKDSALQEELNYDVEYKRDDGFSRIRFEEVDDERYIGSSFTHFLPNYLLSYYNSYARLSDRFFDHIVDGSPSRIWRSLEYGEAQEISEALASKGRELAERLQYHVKLEPSGRKHSEFEEVYERYMDLFQIEDFFELLQKSGLPAEEKEDYIISLRKEFESLSPKYELDRTPSHYIPGVDFTKEFFSNHIWYLGPLREEPKALYPLASDGSMNDVGYKGENTAAVFDNNRNQKIDYVSPSAFDDLTDVKLKKKKNTLEKVVKEWLVYLGVASDIDTDDRGKIGHTLQISNDINLKQDLTHVGVGVSQVLPILVMALLAERGDVIILEQPELHLHPKVQTRLADFFVAMNALGKQCLIETHSEYLINRLRFFVAKSENSKVADDTMIYFVEKEDGHSKYRPVTINKYGVIEDWPDGFFDESSKIAEAILEAGMKKRMEELGIDD